MKADTRVVIQSPLYQGINEQVAYELTATPWGSDPSGVTTKLYSIGEASNLTDVSDTCMSGSPSVDGDIITTPLVLSLTNGTEYQLKIKFIVSGNTLEAILGIIGQL